jgi:hypothetical protein
MEELNVNTYSLFINSLINTNERVEIQGFDLGL